MPWIDILEDRTALSTLTVLNNLDSGAGSLRDAIALADHGDTIVFDDDLTGQTITLTSDQLELTKSLNIQGPGADLLAVSGNDTHRVFAIEEGLTVTLSGLTITHGRGRGSGGGGILNFGSALTLDDTVFSYNQALGLNGAWGGAVSAWNDATLTVTDSTFDGNQALGEGNGGPALGGGGIFIDGRSTATVSRSTFIGNRAVGGDGGVVRGANTLIGNAGGGAIHNDGHFTIEDSTFIANQAIGGSGGNVAGSATSYAVGIGAGGAVFNHEGFEAILVINRCAFSDNLAVGGSNILAVPGQGRIGNGQGGAVFNLGVATVTDSNFEGNRALGGDNNTGGVSAVVGRGMGGAIANLGTFVRAPLAVSNCTFTGNQAIGGFGNAGGILPGAGLGGGVATVFGSVTTITDSTFTGNQAIGGARVVGSNGGDGLGGGIYNDGRSALEVRGSTITDNHATGGAAGDGGSAGSGVGGGLYLEAGGSVCLDEFTIAHLFGNDASTSDDEVFGDYTICE